MTNSERQIDEAPRATQTTIMGRNIENWAFDGGTAIEIGAVLVYWQTNLVLPAALLFAFGAVIQIGSFLHWRKDYGA